MGDGSRAPISSGSRAMIPNSESRASGSRARIAFSIATSFLEMELAGIGPAKAEVVAKTLRPA